MVRRLLASVAPVVAVAAALLAAAPAHAGGYWNLPGNKCQCWGYGWGAGYHACLMLGPITHEDACARNEIRLPYAPQPPYASYGCNNFNYDFRQPSQFAPASCHPVPQQVAPPINGAPAHAPPISEPTLEQPAFEEPLPTLMPDNLEMPEETGPPRTLFAPPVEN